VTAADPKPRIWTILELLRWTTGHFAEQGIETPRLDAECLLASALGVDRMRLYLDFDKPASPAERAAFRELVRRRANERVPVAQLTGRKEFWSMPLRVTADVLSPRPDTETLVAAALGRLPERDCDARVLEIGTGSGAVALAIARERPRARITATDISPAALKLAEANARELGLDDRIEFLEGSVFGPVIGRRFELLVSNPPYLAESERSRLAPELAHEPDVALFAAEEGLAVLRELVAGAATILAPDAGFALELAPAQAPTVAHWLREAGWSDIVTHRDLAGRPRVVSARGPRPPTSEMV
jgi:release factor glutamine methyltransferase